eukprot:g2841.t1
MAAGLPALLLYQLGLPMLLCLATRKLTDLREAVLSQARSHSSRLATAAVHAFASVTLQYKSEWKVRWLFTEMLYKTLLVLCKVFLWKHLEVKCLTIAALVIIYHILIIRWQPFAHGVMTSADGALFFMFLASAASQIGIIVAVVHFNLAADDAEAPAGAINLNHADTVNSTTGISSLNSTNETSIIAMMKTVMDALASALTIAWLYGCAGLLWTYGPSCSQILRRCTRKGQQDQAGATTQIAQLMNKFRADSLSRRRRNRRLLALYGLLLLALGDAVSVDSYLRLLDNPMQVGTWVTMAAGLLLVLGIILLIVHRRSRRAVLRPLAELFGREQRLQDGALVSILYQSIEATVKEGTPWYMHRGDKIGVPVLKDSLAVVPAGVHHEHYLNWVEGEVVGFGEGHLKVKVHEMILEDEWKPTANVDVKSITNKVITELRCVLASKIHIKDLTDTLKSYGCGATDLYALSQPTQIGEVDFFISHAWEAKARAWERVFEEFRREHGREPTVWLDEIVIDQSSLDDWAMVCLPANIMSCNKVMVLCGDTYIDRLWCIWELYTLFALADNENDSFARLVVVDITTGGAHITTRLQDFDVKNAHCYSPNCEYKIRQAIEAGPGGAKAFNQIMRKLGDRLAHQKELADQDRSQGRVGSLRRAATSFLSLPEGEQDGAFLSTLEDVEEEQQEGNEEEGKQGKTSRRGVDASFGPSNAKSGANGGGSEDSEVMKNPMHSATMPDTRRARLFKVKQGKAVSQKQKVKRKTAATG